ncbi:activator-dependent family glycosyltransferase [Streptomyces cyaneofuscatus]|uniref:activator-dependent family glycosyltransferase n=2 Tax=Streptomyces TaxID=1883 RepID=UPI002E1145B4|nr:activator-dependent family glycosyltransferase [Streptomyces cyaneofuscatus]
MHSPLVWGTGPATRAAGEMTDRAVEERGIAVARRPGRADGRDPVRSRQFPGFHGPEQQHHHRRLQEEESTVRILITVWPAAAHLYPSVPLASALQAAGHDVRVASRPSLAGAITAAGLTAVALVDEEALARSTGAGKPASGETERIWARLTEAVDIDPLDLVATHVWRCHRDYAVAALHDLQPVEASAAEPQPVVDELVRFCRSWSPDLVLWDPTMPAAAVAARAVGAAHARLLWGLDHVGWSVDRLATSGSGAGEPFQEDPVVTAVRAMAERYSLPFDDELLHGQWTVDPMPASMRLPTTRRVVPMRWIPYTGSSTVPAWLYEKPARPRVALTLGSSMRAFSKDSTPLIANLLRALGGLDIEVVATLDASQLDGIDHIPANVRTVDYIPLTQLLPTCSAVVHHGGYGTLCAAAAAGVPQIVAIDGDQVMEGPVSAHFLAEAGAGLLLQHQDCSVDDIRKMVTSVLEDGSYQHGARSLHRDLLATPGPAEVVSVLERMVPSHRETS